MKIQELVETSVDIRQKFLHLSEKQQRITCAYLEQFMSGPWQWGSEDKEELLNIGDDEDPIDDEDLFDEYFNRYDLETAGEIFNNVPKAALISEFGELLSNLGSGIGWQAIELAEKQ